MVRVAMITRDYPPRIGGIATHTAALVDALRGLGVEVRVFAGYSDLRTITLPLTRRFGDYDLVHVQSSPYGALLVSGPPMVVTVHSPVLVEWKHYRRGSRLKSLAAVACERLTLSRARRVLSVSEATKDDLVEKYGTPPGKIEVVGNGVDCDRFASDRRGGAVSNRILLVSRLEPRKNIEEALRALGTLPPGSYSARVVGDGSERGRLEELARRLGVGVTFAGAVSADDLPGEYRRSDIFLTTSHSEGFGLSLLEAMAAGCAVVASDIPPHRTIVTDSVDGLLYGTPSSLEAGLRNLTSSPELVTRLGTDAAKTARRYSWEAVAGRVLRAYRECLTGTSA